jgi:hypothetical protein
MTVRARLSNRRGCLSFNFQCGKGRFAATVVHFDDGRLAEISLTNGKVGSDADTAARDSAVVCSIALQYGVPVDVIRKALLRDSDGQPNGPLGIALDRLAACDRDHG